MDKESFIKEIVPLRGILLDYALRQGLVNSHAEDLVQETLLRLWQLRSTLDEHPNRKALSLRILRQKMIDDWRRCQHETADPTREQLSHISNTLIESPPDMVFETEDLSLLIRWIVEHLPPLQQQIFRMKEIEGYESGEIQAIIGCSKESLRQHLSRARKKIREDFIKITERRKRR